MNQSAIESYQLGSKATWILEFERRKNEKSGNTIQMNPEILDFISNQFLPEKNQHHAIVYFSRVFKPNDVICPYWEDHTF